MGSNGHTGSLNQVIFKMFSGLHRGADTQTELRKLLACFSSLLPAASLWHLPGLLFKPEIW